MLKWNYFETLLAKELKNSHYAWSDNIMLGVMAWHVTLKAGILISIFYTSYQPYHEK